MSSRFRIAIVLAVFVAVLLPSARAQEMPSAPAPKTPAAGQGATTTGAQALSLQEALKLARKNSTQFQSAVTDAGIAGEGRAQARDALLPSVNFNTSAIYTQSNGADGVRYIANNAIHEYVSQGNVHQQLDLASLAAYRNASAQAAAAKARAEVASRGLVVTVVNDYFAVAAAQQKLESAQRTSEEGEKFFQLTQNLEKGGEVAHSDVIKAELQFQERRRQFREAQLALVNARLELAVLIFSSFQDNFEIADDLHASVPLPVRADFEAQAANQNPEIRAALAASQAAGLEVAIARAGYLPNVTLDYFYGIDATRYATYTASPNGKLPNLGSSAVASLNLSIWNWGATQSKVRQAELKRDLANKELSFAQRKLLAEMRSLYSEAEASLDELSGLQRSSELAADSLRLTTLRYKNGEATVLEVVDAQSTYASSNAAYHDGAHRYRVALANVQTLTGVLTVP